MKEYNGENPQNARIKINYSGKKPKVKFSYPVNKKDTKTNVSLFPAMMMIWILMNIPVLIYFSLNDKDFFEVKVDYNLSREYNVSNYTDFLRYYNQETKINSTYKLLNEKGYEKIFDKELLRVLLLYSYFILIPLLIYLPFKKKWNKFAPDYQAFMTRKRYKKFNKRDIRTKEEGTYYLELPIFHNVILDFKATKEFSKYLNEFEIEEYKFEYYKKQKSKLTKKKQRPKNETIWYARWYFNEKPKTGELEVIYK